MNLPPTTHDFIFCDLSAKDLLNYSKVNRAARNAVKAFYKRALRVENVLSRYFDDDELRRFRILRYTTGCLVSGSTALSFFERQTFPESDLDLYVDYRFAIFISDFLLSSGYVFEPFRTERKRQAKNIASALEAMDRRIVHEEQENEAIEGFGEYITSGIMDVFSFVRDGKKVQIIATGGPRNPSPLDVIFMFHSTVVMNIIAYSHAISFFPKATFIDHVSVVNETRSYRADQDPPRAKYAERGWKIRKDIDAISFLDRNTVFGISDRYVGDRKCWTVPLPPVTDFSPWSWGLGQDWMLLSNSWNVIQDRSGLEIRACRFSKPTLSHSYALGYWVWNAVRKEPMFQWDDDEGEGDGEGEDEDEDTELLQGKELQLIDDQFCDFIKTIPAQPRPKEDRRDAFVRNTLLQAFKTAREKYPDVELEDHPTASAALRLFEWLKRLVRKLPELPKLTFRFAQDRYGLVWTNVDIEIPSRCISEVTLFIEGFYDVKIMKRDWRINVELVRLAE
ncbi:hypothetical protein VNI00_019346 [Paramarasmius palmivorus]|uniref:F-box domain-containing protein n=1 Tax=Paramarasmius palmivorus TaxID=297713 RepID=A0AAW0AMY1_9AGAR